VGECECSSSQTRPRPTTMDFEVVKKAGLRQTEFAKLCGVSRVTANSWLRGKMKPHRLLQLSVAKRLDLIAEALIVGDLPLAKTVSRLERERRIYTVLTNAALRRKQRGQEVEAVSA